MTVLLITSRTDYTGNYATCNNIRIQVQYCTTYSTCGYYCTVFEYSDTVMRVRVCVYIIVDRLFRKNTELYYLYSNTVPYSECTVQLYSLYSTKLVQSVQ